MSVRNLYVFCYFTFFPSTFVSSISPSVSFSVFIPPSSVLFVPSSTLPFSFYLHFFLLLFCSSMSIVYSSLLSLRCFTFFFFLPSLPSFLSFLALLPFTVVLHRLSSILHLFPSVSILFICSFLRPLLPGFLLCYNGYSLLILTIILFPSFLPSFLPSFPPIHPCHLFSEFFPFFFCLRLL